MYAKLVHCAVAVAFALTLGAGCGAEKKTVKHETVHYSAAPAEGTPVVVEHRVTETTEREERTGGVITATARFVGQVIAFPFRLIGAVFRGIF